VSASAPPSPLDCAADHVPGTRLGLWLWAHGDYSFAPAPGADPTWALEFKHVWIQRFGINVHLALDGLSLLMILLTGLLGVLSVLCSWKEIQRHVGFFHLNLMWILGGVVGVFLALDLFMFFFFWEMMLVPMYFLIALWGHSSSDGKKTRIYAATKFFIFTQASGLIMLVAILGLVLVNFNNTGVMTFNYADLLKTKMSADHRVHPDARLLHRLRGQAASRTVPLLAA
jgi:NADH-quinone oxidoreductase subunit M